eukprot:gnl/Chilomastix_cuspidata/5856.p4 GENE.gnl/Chilomastix_cuspidata/5856~~gnl/Chilomastix_cuspidata/5856.p4  ORF type:complete len:128 (+),score=56.50 gnl/Chilomastix_cuspidata/5856:165-548(+)
MRKRAAVCWHTGAPEIMFTPQLTGRNWLGAHELVREAIGQCARAVQRELWETIVLAGGNTCTAGFAERLLDEVRELCPFKSAARIQRLDRPAEAVWLGGAVAAEIGGFTSVVTSGGVEAFLHACAPF